MAATCGKHDPFCDGEGITRCSGREGCNGFGVVKLESGRSYRFQKNIQPDARAHDACHGTGLRACGCVELDAVALATVSGLAMEVAA